MIGRGTTVSRFLRSFLCACAAFACFAYPAASGQEPGDTASGLTYSVKSQLVQIYMTVTDGGRMVTDLTARDLAIFEDGASKAIARLDNATVPLQVALLFDMSASMLDALPTIQEAATYFIESLRPEDRVTLVLFNTEIQCVPQLTADRGPLLEAIRKAQARNGTRLHDALFFAMKYLSDKEGRKVIVCFTDGDDTAHTTSLPLVLNAAARYGYPIYAIGAGAGLRSERMKSMLRKLAEINSGRMYFKEDPRDLRSAFADIASELRDAYVLNYYTQVPYDGRWHDLRIVLQDPRCKIHSRKGFYAKAGGADSLFADLSDRPAKIQTREAGGRNGPAGVEAPAAREMLQAPLPEREFDLKSLRASLPPPSPPRQHVEKPVFKVESRLVEVPVLLASGSGKDLPELSEKDFRIYEDDSLREITFFGRESEIADMKRLRQAAVTRAQAGGENVDVRQADAQPVTLGRFYLVLDDVMTQGNAFQQAQLVAEKIIREYQHTLRPISLHFIGRSSVILNADESADRMIERVRKATPISNTRLTSNDDIMTVHDAYLIERGDKEARELAELRYASVLQVTFSNGLGSVTGQMDLNPEVIHTMVQSTMVRLVGENASQLNRVVDGLQAIVNAAAAEEMDYPRTMIILSSGFSLGRGSSRTDVTTRFDRVVAFAKSKGIRIFALDPGGLAPDEAVGLGANLAFLTNNPHLMGVLTRHALDWRHEKEAPLHELAGETGGRFIGSTNDLAGAAAGVLHTGGRLYYLAYMSHQPADGRFHRIRVTSSVPGAQVFARKGYYAGRSNEPVAAADASLEGEDWQAVLTRANDALRTKNLPEAEANLAKLVRRFPNNASLWYNLGAVRLQLAQNTSAVDAFQRAFLLSHEDPATGAALTRALIAAGFPDAAIETMETVVRRNPGKPELLVQLGRVYEATGRPAEAYQAYRRIFDLTLAPPLDVYVLLLRTARALDRQTEAAVFARDYIARGGDKSVIDQWRGQTASPALQPPVTGSANPNR
jgi:VWFA-related protein